MGIKWAVFFCSIFILAITFQNCSPTATTAPSTTNTCSLSQLETDLNSELAAVVVPDALDFSFAVEREDGRRFSYQRGASTMQTFYESASTSKMVSAVIILRLVDAGYLHLTDKPQDLIPGWPILNTDTLYNMTLAQLLSFTSGLTTEPLCQNVGISNFATCVNSIATTNQANGIIPGNEFYYSSNHLQVAGLMAIKARGVTTWQDLFTEFKTQTGLFPTSTYDLPSSTNPRLAGGMHWTGDEYMDFLKAFKNGTLLNPATQASMLADHTASPVVITYSPALRAPTDLPPGMGEDWHYGFGLWNECQSPSYNCSIGGRVSSPGSYGAYPYWDQQKKYIGFVARQGAQGTYPNGAFIERSVRSKVEEWVDCP